MTTNQPTTITTTKTLLEELEVSDEMAQMLARMEAQNDRDALRRLAAAVDALKAARATIDAMTDLPVVMLVADMAGLGAAMAKPGAPFWQGLGPNIGMLRNADGSSSGVIEAAHARGIPVHPWTFRDDQPIGGKPIATSMKEFLALGIDGFFTDFAITGYAVRNDVAHGVE